MEEVGAVVNTTVSLLCEVTGHPEPAVSWLRDGQPVRSDTHHLLSQDGTLLQVRKPIGLGRFGYIATKNPFTYICESI